MLTISTNFSRTKNSGADKEGDNRKFVIKKQGKSALFIASCKAMVLA